MADLESYLQPLRRLRSDSKPYWPAETYHRAPHKPLMLLAVIDLIAQGVMAVNFIPFNADLIETFDRYWQRVIGEQRESSPLMPYFHLSSEPFWRLLPRPGMEVALAHVGKIRSIRQLNDLTLGAKLDDDLYAVLLDERSRNAVRQMLIQHHFTEAWWPVLIEVAQITAETFTYSRLVRQQIQSPFRIEEVPEFDTHYRSEARSAGFRRVIVDAYRHTCAMCGVRLLTPEGHSAVAAAHIIPWSESRIDDPRNGIALCGLHHWSFDKGLLTVAPDYHILVSPLVEEAEGTAVIHGMNGMLIRLPADKPLWPAPSALRWHQRKIFRREEPPRLV